MLVVHVFWVRSCPFLAALGLKVGVGDGQRDIAQGDSPLPGQSHLHCPLAGGQGTVPFPTCPQKAEGGPGAALPRPVA